MAKPGHNTDPAIAAQMLAEAVVMGDKPVADKYGVCVRTIQRLRRRARQGSDKDLSREVERKRRVAERKWSEDVSPAIGEHVRFLKRAAEVADPTNPMVIHAIAGSLKMLSEVAATWKLLDARMPQNSRQNREEHNQVPADTAGNVRPIRRTGTN